MTIIPSNLLLIEMPGGGELLIIVVVVLLLFGGKKIPELMKGLGRGIREFNDAKSNVTKELEEGLKTPERPTATTPASEQANADNTVHTTSEPLSTPLNTTNSSHTTPSAN